jgi:transposase
MKLTTAPTQAVIVGVDTHQRTHHAVALDTAGQLVGDQEFPASATGYQDLLDWAAAHGLIQVIGVESTGSYGAGLTTHLLAAGIDVIEVNRPERSTRARQGKSDPIDAESAARQVLAGTATARPKLKTGVVEAIRVAKIPRDSAVKDRTAAYSQLRDLATTAPAGIREELLALTPKKRVATAARYRPDPSRLADPTHAAKRSLRALARRIQTLDAEITEADTVLAALVEQTVPTLLALPQVGVQSAAQLVITAGQNIDRMRSEATFAKLTGTAPIPASSGKTTRVRLNRGGDRKANSTLHLLVLRRMKDHPPTLAYLARRSSENLTTKDLIRCLKRYTARETYKALRTDLLST